MVFHKTILKACVPPEFYFEFQLKKVLILLISEVREIVERILVTFVLILGQKDISQFLVRRFMRVEELELVLRKLIRSLRVVFKVGVENVCD
jgi:hypothetical protein